MKKFNNIKEELKRIKTLMFETDNLILNKITLNENITTETDETTSKMDEEKFKVNTDTGKVKYKTEEGKFKIVKIGDNQFKLKGKGAGQFLDDKGEITKSAYNFISNALPKIGSSLDTDKVIVRLGNKERNTPDVDKIFFTVVPKDKVYAIKSDKTLTNLKDTDLEKKPEQKATEVSTPKTDVSNTDSTKTDATSSSSWAKAQMGKISSPKIGSGTDIKSGGDVAKSDVVKTDTTKTDTSKKLEDKDILGKKLEDLSSLKLNDYTNQFHEKGYKVGFSYKINQENKDIYRFDKNGVVTAIFKRNKSTVSENLNMDFVFINPLLFESVVSEQTSSDYYECMGDCGNQKKMSQKFTSDVDDIISGKKSELPKTDTTKTDTTKTDTTKTDKPKSDTTKKGISEKWTRSFTDGGTVTLTYTNNLLDPTADNIQNLVELNNNLIDCFDYPIGANNLRDFGNYLKNVYKIKINVPDFEGVDKSKLKNYGYFDGATKKFKGQRVFLLTFVSYMYAAQEGEVMSDNINEACTLATLFGDDQEMLDYKKYVKMLYPNKIKCDWAKNKGEVTT